MGVPRGVLVGVLVVLMLLPTGCSLRPWKKERRVEPPPSAGQREGGAEEQGPVLKKYVLKSEDGQVVVKDVSQGESAEAIAEQEADVSGESREETPEARAKRLQGAGIGYFNRRMYDDAIRYFTDAIELGSRDPQLYYYRAKSRILLGAGEPDVQAMLEALEDLEAALDLDGQYYDALVERARIQVQLAHLSRDADLMVGGIADCTAALALGGDSAELLCLRGMAKEYLGELKDEPVVLEQAVLDLSKGLELDPTNGQAYLQRGYILGQLYERYDYELRFLEGAVADFRRACELGVEEGCGYEADAEDLLRTVSAGRTAPREEAASASSERSSAEARAVERVPGAAGAEELEGEERKVFMVIAESRSVAGEIQDMLNEGVDVASVASRYPTNSEVTTVRLSELKGVFQEHLENLELGKSTPIIKDEGYYYIIHLLE